MPVDGFKVRTRDFSKIAALRRGMWHVLDGDATTLNKRVMAHESVIRS